MTGSEVFRELSSRNTGESVRVNVPPLDVVTIELITDQPVFEVKQ
jgi:hypothetical protein